MDNEKVQTELLLGKLALFSDGKYVMADKRISEVLKIIAGSQALYGLFETCSENFDYETMKSKCFINGEVGKEGRFVRPENDNDFLALVFRVLYDFDMRTMDLVRVVYAYFPSGYELLSAYMRFVNEVINPFAELIKHYTDMLFGEIEKTATEHTVKIETVKLDDKHLFIDEDTYKSIKNLLEKDRLTVINSKTDATLKTDTVMFIDALMSACYDGTKDAVKYAFKGYYYVSKQLRLKLSVKEINNILLIKNAI